MSGLHADYARLAEQARTLRQRLQDTVATADSPDGLVTATVSARGEVKALDIDPRVYRTPDSARLAAQVTAAIAEAAEAARRSVFPHARDLLPPTAKASDADVEFDPYLHQLETRKRGGRP